MGSQNALVNSLSGSSVQNLVVENLTKGNAMARRFPNFLAAYCDYSEDGFCPPQFAEWSALSIIAGALERKTWIPWSDTYSFYPNIYVLLVSRPGQGKSVSLSKAVDLLKDVSRKTGTLNILPSQVTEAKFIELMGHGRSFIDTSAGKELTVFQNAGYYYASEASNSLRNIFGDFIACLTDFYDCPPYWERATKKDGRKISLKNVCMNMLAGSTFDYLGKLVSDENIQGGFASRLLYVVQKESTVKEQKYASGQDAEIKKLRETYRAALTEDLTAISNISGPMVATPEYGAAWEKWYPEHQRHVQAFKSEKLQSILARTNTNVLKVSMLLSAAESDSRILDLRHFERAVELVEAVNVKIPDIFLEAKSAQGTRSGGNVLASVIISMIKRDPNATVEGISAAAVIAGHGHLAVTHTINALLSNKALATGAAVAGAGVRLIIKGDTNDYL